MKITPFRILTFILMTTLLTACGSSTSNYFTSSDNSFNQHLIEEPEKENQTNEQAEGDNKIVNPFIVSKSRWDEAIANNKEIQIKLTNDRDEIVLIDRDIWNSTATHAMNDPSVFKVIAVDASLNERVRNQTNDGWEIKKDDSSSLFGLTKEGYEVDLNDTWYAYTGGIRTDIDNMPVQSIATYNGIAKAIPDRSRDYYQGNGVENEILSGTATIRVDFGQNKLNGDLIFNSPYLNDIHVDANIKGAIFKGTATNSNESADLVGQFNGINANEISGAFNSNSNRDQGMAGAFGATR